MMDQEFILAWGQFQAGNLAQAEQMCRCILQKSPGHADAWNLLGQALMAREQLEEAAASFQQAQGFRPNFALALGNLGLVRMKQGRQDEAAACYREALRHDPSFADAHNYLGIVLRSQGKLDEAAACYREALRLQPAYPSAHSNLANVFKIQGQLDEAVVSHREAIRLQPGFAEAHNNLGSALLEQGKIAEALACFGEALHWQANYPGAHSNLLLGLNYDPDADPAAVYQEHCRWGTLHGTASDPVLVHANSPDPERRLRIGYVSPDLRMHAVTRFFEPILAHHDPYRVETFCYAEVPAPDATTDRLRKLAHGWRFTCGMTDAQVADQIRGDGIDILVDLAGHTANHRLRVFAHKPAPVQATYLGYPNTTGLRTIDYKITDARLDPPGEPSRYTEELVRLAGGFCCFAPPADAPGAAILPAIPSGRITFGSLHNLAKTNPTVFDLWGRVLEAVPSSRLLMFRHTLTGSTKEFVLRQFVERGIGGDRLELRSQTSASSHLSLFQEIDISLDVFPWTGHAVSCEALWMGVPVITWSGARPASRLTAGVLASLGLMDLIAQTPERYVALAVELANDWDRLARLRFGLRRLMTAHLCDGPRFTRGLEETYRILWRKWCRKSAGGN